jgi:hypothetical protein
MFRSPLAFSQRGINMSVRNGSDHPTTQVRPCQRAKILYD